MTISKELLDELLSGVENANDLLGDKGLMKELKVRLMERMLGAELTEHLGYEPQTEPANDQSNHAFNIAPNLLDQDFSADGPNQKWAGVISYIWTSEGWLYLALLIPCSRQSSATGVPPSACFNTAMICASLNHPFFIVNLLIYLAEKIPLLNTTNFRGITMHQPGRRFVVSTMSGCL